MLGDQYGNIFESLSGKNYSTQIAISIKSSKITEEAGPKDLTRLTDTWDF